jgi:hypothetical protein
MSAAGVRVLEDAIAMGADANEVAALIKAGAKADVIALRGAVTCGSLETVQLLLDLGVPLFYSALFSGGKRKTVKCLYLHAIPWSEPKSEQSPKFLLLWKHMRKYVEDHAEHDSSAREVFDDAVARTARAVRVTPGATDVLTETAAAASAFLAAQDAAGWSADKEENARQALLRLDDLGMSEWLHTKKDTKWAVPALAVFLATTRFAWLTVVAVAGKEAARSWCLHDRASCRRRVV